VSVGVRAGVRASVRVCACVSSGTRESTTCLRGTGPKYGAEDRGTENEGKFGGASPSGAGRGGGVVGGNWPAHHMPSRVTHRAAASGAAPRQKSRMSLDGDDEVNLPSLAWACLST
jgi:hypothetical protein